MFVRGSPRHLLVVLLLLTPAARASDNRPTTVLPAESKATAGRLAEADRLLADRKWIPALDELQAVLDSAGDDLVSVDASHSVRARQLVHMRIAGLPPEVLQRYRNQVDTRARRWLEQGASTRDAAMLRKVVDEAFCSRPAELALELLGDLAFERGRFAEADAWWRRLVLPVGVSADPDRLIYPDPQGDIVRVRAKQLMAMYFQGDVALAECLKAYRQKHGLAEGILGGRKGKYTDFLTELFAESAEPSDSEPTWTTFGGDATRGRVQPAPSRLLDRLGILCRDGPELRINLASFCSLKEDTPPPDFTLQRSDYSRSLTYHPLIAGHYLYVADSTRVMAFNLLTETRSELFRLNQFDASPQPDLRYTLTFADDCLYARLGPQSIEKTAADGIPVSKEPRKAHESLLVCLRLDPASSEHPVRWLERGQSGKNVGKRGRVVFEGTPIVRDGCVYVAATRFDGGRTITAIHCYTAESPTEPANCNTPPQPVLRWQADICETREPSTAPRYRHHLLTLAGPLVVCCSHSGIVAALDAHTGRPEWATRYQQREQSFDDAPRLTDLAPCVYTAGRLFVAPTDSDSLLCLDPTTGRTLWQRERIEIVHLLGVGASRLIFVTPTGIRAVGAFTGGDAEGWSHETQTNYGKDGSHVGWTPAGRGFLIGDYVIWPTIDPDGRSAVHALRQEDGEPDDNPTLLHRLPPGNIVYAEGCLAVAGREELSVFVPPAWRLMERKQKAWLSPKSATAALALARAEADAGLFKEAAENYRRAEQLANRDRRIQREAKTERQRLWLDVSRQAVLAEQWDEAKAAFEHATGLEFTQMERAAALLEAGKIWKKAGRLDEAHIVLQTICDSDELRDVRLPDLTRAGDRAMECFPNLSKRSLETDAAAALVAAKNAKRLRALPSMPSVPAFPLRTAWETTLDPAEELLPAPGGDVFLTFQRGTPPRLIAREMDDGRRRWCVDVPFFPTWSGSYVDLILAAGTDGIVAVRRQDGVRVWDCLLPSQAATDRLNHFQLSDSDLYCLQGCRRVLVFNATNGRRNQALPVPGMSLAVQTDAGPGPEVNALYGLVFKKHFAAKPWTCDPVFCDSGIVTVEGNRRVVYSSDDGSGKTDWSYTIPGRTTLTGRPARIAGNDDALFLLVEANIGYQLQRLDRATGKPLWPQPVLLREPISDPGDWTMIDSAVCLVEEGTWTAHSLSDGKLLWETNLGEPGRAWRVERLLNGLLVYPASVSGRQFAFRWLSTRLQWTVVPDTREAVGHGFPIICCDMAGRVQQRFDLAAGAPALRFDCFPSRDPTLVPLAREWRGTAAGCSPVQVNDRSVVVVVGSYARGLIPAGAK